MTAPLLVPLPPDTSDADLELDRAREFLRKRLAEGNLHPDRHRLILLELAKLEAERAA
jgi:uncharacterized membrane protein